MLVLTRKAGQQIRIADNIVLTVLTASGRHIRLGIEGPPEVCILRAELVPGGKGAATDGGGLRKRNPPANKEVPSEVG
jgi:carbon storage regulator CsrA